MYIYIYKYLYLYTRVDYSDLSATSVGIMVNIGNHLHLQMASIQVRELFWFTQMHV